MKTIRNRYSEDRFRSTYDPTDHESITHQSHADSCDINKIMNRFAIQRVTPPPPEQPLQYADLSDVQQADPATLIIKSRATLAQLDQALQAKHIEETEQAQKAYDKMVSEHALMTEKLQTLEKRDMPIHDGTPIPKT